jgi:hypothetical protein
MAKAERTQWEKVFRNDLLADASEARLVSCPRETHSCGLHICGACPPSNRHSTLCHYAGRQRASLCITCALHSSDADSRLVRVERPIEICCPDHYMHRRDRQSANYREATAITRVAHSPTQLHHWHRTSPRPSWQPVTMDERHSATNLSCVIHSGIRDSYCSARFTSMLANVLYSCFLARYSGSVYAQKTSVIRTG